MNKKIIFFFIIFLTTIVANSQIDDPRVFRRDLTFQDELTFGGKLSTMAGDLTLDGGILSIYGINIFSKADLMLFITQKNIKYQAFIFCSEILFTEKSMNAMI